MKLLLILAMFAPGFAVGDDDAIRQRLREKYILHIDELDRLFEEIKDEAKIQNDLALKIGSKEIDIDVQSEKIKIQEDTLKDLIPITELAVTSFTNLGKSCDSREVKKYLSGAKEKLEYFYDQSNNVVLMKHDGLQLERELQILVMTEQASEKREKLIVERFNRVKEWIHELIIQYNDLASGEPSSSGGSSTAGNSSSSGNGEGQVDVRLPISWDPASKCLESGKSLSECLGIKLKQREPLLPGWRDLIDVIPTDPREIIRGPLTTITSQ